MYKQRLDAGLLSDSLDQWSSEDSSLRSSLKDENELKESSKDERGGLFHYPARAQSYRLDDEKKEESNSSVENPFPDMYVGEFEKENKQSSSISNGSPSTPKKSVHNKEYSGLVVASSSQNDKTSYLKRKSSFNKENNNKASLIPEG